MLEEIKQKIMSHRKDLSKIIPDMKRAGEEYRFNNGLDVAWDEVEKIIKKHGHNN